MEAQNKLSISYWTTWETKAATPHDKKRILNILLAGLALILDVELLEVVATKVGPIADQILDTIPEDFLWIPISMLPNGIQLMIYTATFINNFFI